MAVPLLIKITSKHQVTFPVSTLEALGVRAGDYLNLVHDRKNSWRILPMPVNYAKLAPLRKKIPATAPAFDLAKWRNIKKDYAGLRD